MPIRQINKDFNKNFYRRKVKNYLGRLLNFFYLVLILIITFISIDSPTSLDYLKKKNDDPFIKWVDVEIPYIWRIRSQI